MTTFDLIVRVIHVISASIWIGAAFFAAWFLMPAIRDTGPDGGTVMMAVQKRGWVAAVPIIATLTVVSGFWLYRPYMGAEGNAAMILGRMRERFAQAGVDRIDYIALADPETLAPVSEVSGRTLAVIAAHVGTTRLIDNRLIV